MTAHPIKAARTRGHLQGLVDHGMHVEEIARRGQVSVELVQRLLNGSAQLRIDSAIERRLTRIPVRRGPFGLAYAGARYHSPSAFSVSFNRESGPYRADCGVPLARLEDTLPSDTALMPCRKCFPGSAAA